MNRKKIIYSILKELEQGNKPVCSDYEIDKEKWGEISELILDEGYARNIQVTRGGIGNKVAFVSFNFAKITIKGIEFLKENSTVAKTYKGIKEVRDWLKL